jgi:hypothetical protein
LAIEETLNDADLQEPTVTDDTYTVTVDSSTEENTFSIARAANGQVTLSCTTPTVGTANDGCRADGTWGD